MTTFRNYINKETETINDFDKCTGNSIRIRKIMNEGFSSYDFIFTYKDKYIYFTEVKTRLVNHNDYPDTILEKSKVDKIWGLINEANKIKKVPAEIRAGFIVKFKDDTIYFFDLKTTPKTLSIKKCPRNTASDGNNVMIEKVLYHYKINDGKKIK